MRNIFMLLFLLLLSQTSTSQFLDSLKVYYMPFNSSTPYGLWENDLIENKSPRITLSDIPNSKLEVTNKLYERLSFITVNGNPLKYQDRDLRMVCILYNSDESQYVIGISYANEMSINGMLYPRDKQLIEFLLKLIGNRNLSKTVNRI